MREFLSRYLCIGYESDRQPLSHRDIRAVSSSLCLLAGAPHPLRSTRIALANFVQPLGLRPRRHAEQHDLAPCPDLIGPPGCHRWRCVPVSGASHPCCGRPGSPHGSRPHRPLPIPVVRGVVAPQPPPQGREGVRRRESAVPFVAAQVLRQCVQMKRWCWREWIPMLPWPTWPLAGHARFGQNAVVGSMLVLRVALGNVPRGVCLDPRLHYKCTFPRLPVELPPLGCTGYTEGEPRP
jgi:hypothetical protein